MVKILKRVFVLVYAISAIYYLIYILLRWWMPAEHWSVNLLSYLLPPFIGFNILTFLLLLAFKTKWTLLPLLLIITTYKSLTETFQINFFRSKEIPQNAFTVLSYNVAMMHADRSARPYTSIDTKIADDIFDIIDKYQPDIMCFQEFHHHDTEKYRMIDSIRSYGYNTYFMNPSNVALHNGFFGPVIFSKFPSTENGDGEIIFKSKGSAFNRTIYLDLLIGEDTVRVINAHLNSMSIRLKEDEATTHINNIIMNTSDVINRLNQGFNDRVLQVKELDSLIAVTSYPIIFCADMNEKPYAYSYQTIKKRLSNAFEEGGHGFGYSINRFPYWVRIDQIFISKSYKTHTFEVLRSYDQSDHYPIFGRFSKEMMSDNNH